MTFEVVWSDRARRHLAGLPPAVQIRIIRKARAAAADPLRHFARMTDVGAWRLRVGDYRVIADLRLGERRIEVLAIGHRRNVYG